MKPGDRFRFAAEGVVVEKTPGVHGVTFDGHEHSRLNYLLDEFFAAHAELIPPPYVPQVGDIVMTPDGYGVVLDEGDAGVAALLRAVLVAGPVAGTPRRGGPP